MARKTPAAAVSGSTPKDQEKGRTSRLPSVQSATKDLFRREIESPTIQRLLIAAVDCFWKSGFHASSTRDIAKKANLSPAAVYVHFKSKEDLLFRIIQIVAGDVLRQIQETAAMDGDPRIRLWRIVQASVALPARVYKAATVVNTEFAVLSPAQRKYVMQIRDALDDIVESCLKEGCAAGQFQIDDLPVTKTAIVALCRSVLTWYSPRGSLSPEDLGAAYGDLVIRMVKAD
ncbi:TetR family transcriptional regulator [Zhengella mangrovi]|uniref:TetR family transcriptional regulator n=1 Tax=Zhengella mangrovi TaxID=1982044 RepID=A0A2G1QH37_9HYPH|nr:TetR/AcrR family transcriptional regulator [Zhengella mangrovi]PHP64833.1 TetR family transcriptional regulator [Zhengella mangrovi]